MLEPRVYRRGLIAVRRGHAVVRQRLIAAAATLGTDVGRAGDGGYGPGAGIGLETGSAVRR